MPEDGFVLLLRRARWLGGGPRLPVVSWTGFGRGGVSAQFLGEIAGELAQRSWFGDLLHQSPLARPVLGARRRSNDEIGHNGDAGHPPLGTRRKARSASAPPRPLGVGALGLEPRGAGLVVDVAEPRRASRRGPRGRPDLCPALEGLGVHDLVSSGPGQTGRRIRSTSRRQRARPFPGGPERDKVFSSFNRSSSHGRDGCLFKSEEQGRAMP